MVVGDGTNEEEVMRQKLLALLLVLVLAFGGLTACGEDAGENVPSEGQTEGDEGGEGEED